VRRSVCFALMRAQETVVVGAVVFGAAVLALVLWSAATAVIIDRLPASHWMTVERLDIRDAAEGETQPIDYERTFHRAFTGRYIVAVWSLTRERLECDNESNWVRYRKGRHKSRVDLRWFMGRECNLAPGDYELSATWEIAVLGEHTLKFTLSPRRFTIRPR